MNHQNQPNDISSEIDELFITDPNIHLAVDTNGDTIMPEYTKQAILHLIQSQREELIARFEEIIGEDEHYGAIQEEWNPAECSDIEARNQLRQTQRQALKELL